MRCWLVVLRFTSLLCFPSCFPCCDLRSAGSDLCLPAAVFTVLPSGELRVLLSIRAIIVANCWGIRRGTSMSKSGWNNAEANKLPETVSEIEERIELPKDTKRKRIVVVGLGMVGIAFM